jgi:very-short-patch-repair endonuclease
MQRNQHASTRRQLLAKRALAMRTSPTTSEDALWRMLRSQQLGVRFRRQVPIGRFVVDFLAPSHRLVVEVDGGYHLARAHLDARRDSALARLGYRVLRIEAPLVLAQPAAALARIRDALAG